MSARREAVNNTKRMKSSKTIDVEQYAAAVDHLNAFKSRSIRIESLLTDTKGSIDRHAATRTTLSFVLAHCGIRHSGNKLYLYSEDWNRYEIHGDATIELKMVEGEVTMAEQLGGYFRYSRVIAGPDDAT